MLRLQKLVLRISFLISLFITQTIAFSQNKIIDSLEKLVHVQKDSALANTYNELTWQYRLIDREKAIIYGNKAIELATKIKYPQSLAQAYNDLGIIYYDKENFDTAIALYNKAVAIRKQLKDDLGLAKLYSKLGILYHQKGVYDSALTNQFMALELFKKTNVDVGTATALNNIGNANQNLGRLDEALEYHQKALLIRKKINDIDGMAMSYGNLATVYSMQKKYAESENNFKNAISLLEHSTNKDALASILNNYARLLIDNKQFDKAIAIVNEALGIRYALKNTKGIVSCYSNLGDIFFDKKDYKTADSIYKKAIAISETAIDCLLEKNLLYLSMAKLNETTGDSVTALVFYKKYIATKDSLYTENVSSKFAELETKYKTLEQETKIQVQQFEISKRNNTIIIIVVVFVLAIVIAYLLYARYKSKQESRLQAEVLKQQSMATKAVIEAEERERKRIASDLHDGIGQLFTAVKINLEVLVERFMNKQPEANVLAEKTIAMVNESCVEVRSIAHQMMPNALIKNGLVSALRNFIYNISSDKLKITVEAQGLTETLDSNIETVLYRVIQESVNNTIKHANATMLDILLLCDNTEITIAIEDNGVGFNTADKSKFQGIGLKNMVTRIEYLKGTVDISSSPGKGTLVAIHIPLT